MAMFRYEAIDASGKMLRGVMQATDYKELSSKLSARGLRLQNAYDTSGSTVGHAAHNTVVQTATRQNLGTIPGGLASVMVPPGFPVSTASVVKPKYLAYFLRQLTTMVTAGIPLSQSMRENLQYIRHPRLRTATEKMAEHIDRGSKLSESMAMMPEIFPAHLVGSVVCGELGGDIDVYLAEAASDYERETRDYGIGRIGWILTKLTIIQFIMGLPIILAVRDVMVDLLAGPASSQMSFALIMSTYFERFYRIGLPIGTAGTLIYIASIYVWDAYKKIPNVRHLLDCYRVRFSPWGKLHRNRSIARFIRSLDRLVSAGVDISRSWEASMLVCRDSSVGVELMKGCTVLGDSVGLTERFNRSGILQVEEIGIMNSGEKAGKIGESLSILAASYENLDSSHVNMGRLISGSAFVIFTTIISGIMLVPLARSAVKFFEYLMNDF